MLIILLTAANALMTSGAALLLYKMRRRITAGLATQVQLNEEHRKVTTALVHDATKASVSAESILLDIQRLEVSVAEHERAAERQADVAANQALAAEYQKRMAGEHAEKAGRYATTAAESVVLATSQAVTAASHRDEAATHHEKAHLMSIAVIESAKSAAASRQRKNVECYACHRSVNQFALRDGGQVVCKYCSDRGK